MRILTVRQPWAWAIVRGRKDVENRPRNVAGEYRGPIAIHAGLEDDLYAFATSAALRTATRGVNTAPWALHHGAIIGVVDLVGVHHPGNSELEPEPGDPDYPWRFVGCSPWAEFGSHHLVLTNPRPLSEPIPWKGAQGLRRLPVDIAAEIERRAL